MARASEIGISRFDRLLNKVNRFMFGPEPGYVAGMGFSPGGLPAARMTSPQKLHLLDKFMGFTFHFLKASALCPENLLIWNVIERFGKPLLPGTRKALLELSSEEARKTMIAPKAWKDTTRLNDLIAVSPKDKAGILKQGARFEPGERGRLIYRDYVCLTPAPPDPFRVRENILAYLHYTGQIDLLMDTEDRPLNRMLLVSSYAGLLAKLGQGEKAADLMTRMVDVLKLKNSCSLPVFAETETPMFALFGALKAIRPEITTAEDLGLILNHYQDQGRPENLDTLLVNAGFLYPEKMTDKAARTAAPLTTALLKWGQACFDIYQPGTDKTARFLKFWQEVKDLPAEFRSRLIQQIGAKARTDSDPVLAILIKELLDNGEIDLNVPGGIASYKLKAQMSRNKINNPELIRRLEEDPTFGRLLPRLLAASGKKPEILKAGHLFNDSSEIEEYLNWTALSLKQIFEIIGRMDDPSRIARLWTLIEGQFNLRDAVFNDDYRKVIEKLLKMNVLDQTVRKQMEECYQVFLRDKFHYLADSGQPADNYAEKIREVARDLAEVAHKTLGLIRSFAREKDPSSGRAKPQLSIYILSTGHGFNGERILDHLYKDNAARQDLLQKIKQMNGFFAEKVTQVEALPAGVDRTETEMRIIHKAFYKHADSFQKLNGSDRVAAIMAAGCYWIEMGYLDYFSYPLEIKIPSGSNPPSHIVKQLQDLALSASRNGWDIMLIDHSTVRHDFVQHRGDPPESEKGRAIARALEIMKEALAEKGLDFLKTWLYIGNDWQDVPYKNREVVNLVGLNLYDGKIYDEHVFGPKPEWLKIDDHQKTMLGVAAGKLGEKVTGSLAVLEKSKTGNLRPVSVPRVYWTEFRRALAEMEAWPPTSPSFKFNNLLFVCNANHHRSPTFEILLKKLMREQLGPDAEKLMVASAGLEVEDYIDKFGRRDMSGRAKEMLRRHGIGVDKLIKTPLTAEMAGAADLILVMTRRERTALLKKFPFAFSKVKTVKEFLGFSGEEEDLTTPSDFNDEMFCTFKKLALDILDKIVV